MIVSGMSGRRGRRVSRAPHFVYFTSMDLSDDTIAVHVYSTCLEVSIIAVSFTIPFICPVHALGPLGGVLGWCCLFVHGLLYFTYIKRVLRLTQGRGTRRGSRAMLQESLLSDNKRDTSWKWIFMANVFFGCISFSIVMPNLWLYLHSMNVSKPFYACVVASFSVGEALSTIALGSLSNHIGIKRSLKLCSCLGMTGASSYALSHFVYGAISPDIAPFVVLGAGRLLQGIAGLQQVGGKPWSSRTSRLQRRLSS